jgi:hypothetical protein
MAKSLYSSGRSEGIAPRIAIVTPVQVGIIVAIAMLLCVDWAIGAYRARVATRTDTAVSVPGNCPQSADTFDSRRAACLRRRWSAMRDMKPWPDASANALLEDCLRSARGDIVVPFKPNTCSDQKTVSRPPRPQD